MMLDTAHIQCPYCWESIEIVVDPSAGSQTYVEDCFVCCRPIEITVDVDYEGDINVSAKIEGGDDY